MWSDWRDMYDFESFISSNYRGTIFQEHNENIVTSSQLGLSTEKTDLNEAILLKIIIKAFILDDYMYKESLTERETMYRVNISLNKAHALLLYSVIFNDKLTDESLETYVQNNFKAKFYKTNAMKNLITQLDNLIDKGLIDTKTKDKVVKYVKKNK